MRLATMKALEITEGIYRTMSRGELEARLLAGERARASAPADVSSQLRITAQAEADAWQQSADAEVAHDQPGAANAKALASQMTAEKTRLEAMNATYEEWAGSTGSIRDAAGNAKVELGRRGQAHPKERPQTKAGWWQQLEADLDAMDRAIGREHQAAIAAGRPWPPQKTAQAESGRSEAGAVTEQLQHEGDLQAPDGDPPVPDLNPPRRPLRRSHRGRSPVPRPAWTSCRPARTRLRSVSPRTTLTGRRAPSTPHASNAKPTLNRRPNGRPRPRTRRKSSCRSGRVPGGPLAAALPGQGRRLTCITLESVGQQVSQSAGDGATAPQTSQADLRYSALMAW